MLTAYLKAFRSYGNGPSAGEWRDKTAYVCVCFSTIKSESPTESYNSWKLINRDFSSGKSIARCHDRSRESGLLRSCFTMSRQVSQKLCKRQCTRKPMRFALRNRWVIVRNKIILVRNFPNLHVCIFDRIKEARFPRYSLLFAINFQDIFRDENH